MERDMQREVRSETGLPKSAARAFTAPCHPIPSGKRRFERNVSTGLRQLLVGIGVAREL